jgi:hypothetical protein
MRDRFLRALVAAVAATTLAASCGGAPQPRARQTVTASPPATLTSFEACHRLRDDLARNQGVPDIPTLRLIADHVTAPRLAADARTAVRDIGHTGIAPLALELLREECARAGVQIRPGELPATPRAGSHADATARYLA